MLKEAVLYGLYMDYIWTAVVCVVGFVNVHGIGIVKIQSVLM